MTKQAHEHGHEDTAGGCCSASRASGDVGAPAKVKDPVCAMDVDPAATPHHATHGGREYRFCSGGCRAKFVADPERYLSDEHQAVPEAAPGAMWTCPMHPQIRREGPGTCPICGMALEPEEPSLDDAPNPELVDFTRRTWRSRF